MNHFDKEKVYDEEIFPLITKVVEICQKHEIPMVASFTYKAYSESTDRCTTILNGFKGRFEPIYQAAHAMFRSPERRSLSIMITKKDGEIERHEG